MIKERMYNMKNNKAFTVSTGLIVIVLISAFCIHSIPAIQAFAHSISEISITSYDEFRSTVIGKEFDVDGYPTGQPYQCYDGAAVLWQIIGRSLSTGGNDAKGTWLNASVT